MATHESLARARAEKNPVNHSKKISLTHTTPSSVAMRGLCVFIIKIRVLRFFEAWPHAWPHAWPLALKRGLNCG